LNADALEVRVDTGAAPVAVSVNVRAKSKDGDRLAEELDIHAEDAAIEASAAVSAVPVADLAQAQAASAATATDAAAPAAGAAGATPAIGGVLVGVGALGLIAATRDKNSPPTNTGKVVDGYIAGATVFIDTNRNGQPDAGEPITQSDAQGNFTLPQGVDGPVVAFGGRDVTTGVDFTGILKAPAGSTAVTPLTTLVTEVMRPLLSASGKASWECSATHAGLTQRFDRGNCTVPQRVQRPPTIARMEPLELSMTMADP
jgi:hypothetical protein